MISTTHGPALIYQTPTALRWEWCNERQAPLMQTGTGRVVTAQSGITKAWYRFWVKRTQDGYEATELEDEDDP